MPVSRRSRMLRRWRPVSRLFHPPLRARGNRLPCLTIIQRGFIAGRSLGVTSRRCATLRRSGRIWRANAPHPFPYRGKLMWRTPNLATLRHKKLPCGAPFRGSSYWPLCDKQAHAGLALSHLWYSWVSIMPLLIHSAMTALHCFSDRCGWPFWTTRHAARSVVAACFSAEYRCSSLGPRSIRSRISLAAEMLISAHISGGVPRLDGRHFIAVRIEIGTLAERHADDTEPPRLDRGRGDVDLGAVNADRERRSASVRPNCSRSASVIGVMVSGAERRPGRLAPRPRFHLRARPRRPCAHVAAGQPHISCGGEPRQDDRHSVESVVVVFVAVCASPAGRSRRHRSAAAMKARSCCSSSPGTTTRKLSRCSAIFSPVGVHRNSRPCVHRRLPNGDFGGTDPAPEFVDVIFQ